MTQTPEREPGAFQWTVGLTRADGERSRDGFVDAIDSAEDDF